MVAKTPPKQRKMVAAAAATLNPVQVRETLKKVEMCMNRLQELQFTVTGGNKMISGVSLSPRSTRSYLKTSFRCKQESQRINHGGDKKSPVGKFPANTGGGEWQSMSLPAMLVGETIGEILTASKFAREMVEAVTTKNTTMDDPKTPLARHRIRRPNLEDSELRARRKREKQEKQQSKRIESQSPSLQRVRSRINFKVVSPPSKRDVADKENAARYMANRVSPRNNRPWTKKTILFPNPLFLSSDTSQQPKSCRTKSPVIAKTRQQTPHKFLIKSPGLASKFQVKITRSPTRPLVITRSPTRPVVITRSPTRPVVITRSPTRPVVITRSPTRPLVITRSPTRSVVITRSPTRPVVITRSPTRPLVITRHVSLSKQSPKRPVGISRSPTRQSPPKRSSAASKLRRSFSPSRLVPSKMRQSFSPSRMMTASKLRQTFSPSRLAARLVSPLKSRKNVHKFDGHINVSGLKQRPISIQMRI